MWVLVCVSYYLHISFFYGFAAAAKSLYVCLSPSRQQRTFSAVMTIPTYTHTYTHTNRDDQGHFNIFLGPFAAGGPHEMIVKNENTQENVTLEDVLIGDVSMYIYSCVCVFSWLYVRL